jgi:hypothetical protein
MVVPSLLPAGWNVLAYLHLCARMDGKALGDDFRGGSMSSLGWRSNLGWSNLGELPDDETPNRCQREYEFGQLQCYRDAGHPGPHMARWAGGHICFNNAGERVEGGSEEDYV